MLFINKLNPKYFTITWCYSLNEDMAMTLRSEGTFALMLMTHDLKLSTGKLKLDEY